MYPEDEIQRYRRVTAPRRPWDERLPDGTPAMEVGMRGTFSGTPLSDLLAANPTLAEKVAIPLGTPPPPMVLRPPNVPPAGPPVPANAPVPPIHLGSPVAQNANNLQRLLAERDALSQADPASKVARRDWGYEIQPPERTPSRLRHAGLGAAQGAILAGQATGGDPWGTLAGTVVGALTGGVSPSLLQAFQRRQELDRNAGELGLEQKLQLQNAQIGETDAQAEQRRMQPLIEAEKLRRQEEQAVMLEEGRNRRTEATNKTRVQTATEANKARQAALEETRRHNRETERKPGSKYRTVANTIFEVDDDGVWRVAPGAPPPFSPSDAARAERQEVRSTERDEKARQAEALFKKGSEYWDQAKAKREEARKLGLGPDGNPSRVASTRNEDAINRLLREAANLEGQTRDVQIRGDILAAESESQPAAGSSGRTLKGAKAAFRAKYNREPTAEETERMKRALGQ